MSFRETTQIATRYDAPCRRFENTIVHGNRGNAGRGIRGGFEIEREAHVGLGQKGGLPLDRAGFALGPIIEKGHLSRDQSSSVALAVEAGAGLASKSPDGRRAKASFTAAVSQGFGSR